MKKVLLTGANGYIGMRLLPVLVEQDYKVICSVRDQERFNPPESLLGKIEIIEVDFLEQDQLSRIPDDIDAAYYLLHSMTGNKSYQDLELACAKNFRERLEYTQAEQVIFLTGMTNENELSEHLASRQAVEQELAKGKYALTALRAGIVIGSGSASFEIIRDLVEKLPVMVAPKWIETKCQPIGIRDVIQFLSKSLFCKEVYNDNFDIGCPDVLSYKEMLLGYAEARGLKRRIMTVPIMTPKLSSYWLYFVTSTSYQLATSLVDSMKVEVVCRDHRINELLGIEPIPYAEALQRTLQKVQSNEVISSWKDSMISGTMSNIDLSEFVKVPEHGCFIDKRSQKIEEKENTIDKIWRIGGKTGWYYADWLWKTRGLLDKMVGGVGLRRGRTHEDKLDVGDAVDFWRVLYANKEKGRLLLFAEMKLPGEAWLEFKLKGEELVQTATFRPRGVWGRLYWYSVLPFHGFIFREMLNALAE